MTLYSRYINRCQCLFRRSAIIQNIICSLGFQLLKCNLMNKKYAVLRKNPVKLIFNTYTGYQVNNKAVREINGQKGVYVLNGNIVKFKKINIVYSDSEYSICSVPDGESGYLKQYDEIIVEGTDLYDGKILD